MRTLGLLSAIAVGSLLATYALPTQAEAIKIGISQPISGTNGDYFKRQFVNPAILAIEEFNAKGGLLGQKISYVIEDNRANAGTAQAVARKLVDVDRVSMISISISPAVLATLPISDPKQVIVMTVSQHPKILTSEWAALSTPTAGDSASRRLNMQSAICMRRQRASCLRTTMRFVSPGRHSKTNLSAPAVRSWRLPTSIPKIRTSELNSQSYVRRTRTCSTSKPWAHALTGSL